MTHEEIVLAARDKIWLVWTPSVYWRDVLPCEYECLATIYHARHVRDSQAEDAYVTIDAPSRRPHRRTAHCRELRVATPQDMLRLE